MKRLGIDTSTNAMSLALSEGQELIATTNILSGRQHGALLTDAVGVLLGQVNWTGDQIQELYIGVGPGSYTGLRIGVTMAKVWGSQLELPVYSVSSLALLASQAYTSFQTNSNALVIPFVDARRGTVYTGGYQLENGEITSVYTDRHQDWEEFLAELDFSGFDRIYLVGENPEDFIQALTDKTQLPLTKIKAYPLVERALTGQVPSQPVKDIDTLTPNYAQRTLAEREWAQKTGNQLEPDGEKLVERYSAQ